MLTADCQTQIALNGLLVQHNFTYTFVFLSESRFAILRITVSFIFELLLALVLLVVAVVTHGAHLNNLRYVVHNFKFWREGGRHHSRGAIDAGGWRGFERTVCYCAMLKLDLLRKNVFISIQLS